jgi:hypothetical protein
MEPLSFTKTVAALLAAFSFSDFEMAARLTAK